MFLNLVQLNGVAVPPAETMTNQFIQWYLIGLLGIGGWFLFFLIALAAIAWMFYDSISRKISALGWKMSIILIACLLIPTIIYRFMTDASKVALNIQPGAYEVIFYLGIFGGIVPLVLAIGYFVTFRGLRGCPNGHIYDAGLPNCPECQPKQAAYYPPVNPGGYQGRPDDGYTGLPVKNVRKRKTAAWLVTQDGRQHQLCQGATTIGRSSDNDIVLTSDTTLGRMHARISESNGHYKLADLDSSNGTFVNGKRITKPMILESDDEIRFGQNTTTNFKC